MITEKYLELLKVKASTVLNCLSTQISVDFVDIHFGYKKFDVNEFFTYPYGLLGEPPCMLYSSVIDPVNNIHGFDGGDLYLLCGSLGDGLYELFIDDCYRLGSLGQAHNVLPTFMFRRMVGNTAPPNATRLLCLRFRKTNATY